MVRFFNEYRKNNNINLKKFFNKNYNYLDTYIPPYVDYLIKNNELDKLKKILLMDYFYYYPSIKNTINLTFYKINNIIVFIEYFIAALMSGVIVSFSIIAIPQTIGQIVNRIKGTSFSNIEIWGINMPMFMFTIFGLVILLLCFLALLTLLNLASKKIDIYTYDEKIISEIVKSKEKRYMKLKKKIYFI